MLPCRSLDRKQNCYPRAMKSDNVFFCTRTRARGFLSFFCPLSRRKQSQGYVYSKSGLSLVSIRNNLSNITISKSIPNKRMLTGWKLLFWHHNEWCYCVWLIFAGNCWFSARWNLIHLVIEKVLPQVNIKILLFLILSYTWFDLINLQVLIGSILYLCKIF